MKKLILIMFLLLIAGFCNSQVITLIWDANIESDLAGYKIHYGYSPGNYTQIVNVGNVTTWEVTLANGHYYFAATAYDQVGNESGYSNEVDTLLAPLQITSISYADARIICTWASVASVYNVTCSVAGHSESIPTFNPTVTLIIPDINAWVMATITIDAIDLQNNTFASITTTIDVPNSCDIDGDGKVYNSDFEIFTECFGCRVGSPCYKLAFDTNRDGIIYSRDFEDFTQRYGMQAGSMQRLGKLRTTFKDLKGQK